MSITEEERGKYRAIFDDCDINKSGTIDKFELIQELKNKPDLSLSLDLPTHIFQNDKTKQAFFKGFEEMDGNHDNHLSFEEFLAVIERHKKAKPLNLSVHSKSFGTKGAIDTATTTTTATTATTTTTTTTTTIEKKPFQSICTFKKKNPYIILFELSFLYWFVVFSCNFYNKNKTSALAALLLYTSSFYKKINSMNTTFMSVWEECEFYILFFNSLYTLYSSNLLVNGVAGVLLSISMVVGRQFNSSPSNSPITFFGNKKEGETTEDQVEDINIDQWQYTVKFVQISLLVVCWVYWFVHVTWCREISFSNTTLITCLDNK